MKPGPSVLAIGGLDPSANAGLFADVAAVNAAGGRGQGVATAITVQSAKTVSRVSPVSPSLVVAQIERLFYDGVRDDRPRALKLGMLAEAATARALARFLKHELGRLPLVIDPVLRSSSGAVLFRGQVPKDYRPLLSLARVVTPNLTEAGALLGYEVGQRHADRIRATRALADQLECAVILKGGHALRDADDLVADEKDVHVLAAPRSPVHRRGTGCRFASVLATRLALGDPLLAAARAAKTYVQRYLSP